jgi:hypothetical protein
MNVSQDYTKDYGNKCLRGRWQNKPNQTQFQTQTNPIAIHHFHSAVSALSTVKIRRIFSQFFAKSSPFFPFFRKISHFFSLFLTFFLPHFAQTAPINPPPIFVGMTLSPSSGSLENHP